MFLPQTKNSACYWQQSRRSLQNARSAGTVLNKGVDSNIKPHGLYKIPLSLKTHCLYRNLKRWPLRKQKLKRWQLKNH